jgi:hypothetical protein
MFVVVSFLFILYLLWLEYDSTLIPSAGPYSLAQSRYRKKYGKIMRIAVDINQYFQIPAAGR